jgi:hypothetical protein
MVSKKYYSIQEKKRILKVIRNRKHDESIRSWARYYKTQPQQYRKWLSEIYKLEEAADSSKKTLHCGTPSQYESIKEELLRFLFEIKECYLPITTDLVVMKAADMKESIGEKSPEAQSKMA